MDDGCKQATAKDVRRQAIMQIARDIFLEEGYAAASMSAIAARLGGSKGTLYNYFASKEELFKAVIQDWRWTAAVSPTGCASWACATRPSCSARRP
jgi:AcrR family transcriptional regulator